MSQYTEPLIVSPLTKYPNWWVVMRKFYYYLEGYKEDGAGVVVPKGFVTDFASIPRFLWPILSPWDVYCKACIIHDYLYRTKTCSRKLADQTMYEAAIVIGTPKWKAKTLYIAVRLFGWKGWYFPNKKPKIKLVGKNYVYV